MVTDSENFNVVREEPEPPPDPEYTGREIVVTPQNYRDLLINDGAVDYSGTTSEYVRLYKPSAGSGPAVECHYENLEIELDVYTESGSGRLYQLCTRGGRHTNSNHCTGNCYKGAFRETSAHFRKELFHRSSSLPGGNGYCSDRDGSDRSGYQSLLSRRVRIMFRCRNISGSGDVQLENFADGVRVGTTIDRGDWYWTKTNLPICPALEFTNTGNRRANEKMNKAGVWAILRADYTRHRMYRCTIREVTRIDTGSGIQTVDQMIFDRIANI